MKSIHNAMAKAARLNPLRTEKAAPEKTAPSGEAIGIKAYEIWMSRGQEPGHDQEHWFEAERAVAAGLIEEIATRHAVPHLGHHERAGPKTEPLIFTHQRQGAGISG